MIFRQMFDRVSCTYTYLLAGGGGAEALLIDPVLENVERYLQLIGELDLKLVKALDTHVHADHVTGLGALRDRTRCITVMGEMSGVDVVSMRIRDGDEVGVEGIALKAIHTPGHTSDSFSFAMADRVFTGDTLLIRGTGRTDFQNGDARQQYHSLFAKLLTLPEATLVYPGHDYKGDTVSTIGEERAYNPRLQVESEDAYVTIMENLNLPNPKLMDVAVPANLRIGLNQEEIAARGWALRCPEALAVVDDGAVLLVDLRDDRERTRNGVIPGSVHVPYAGLDKAVEPGGVLRELATRTGRDLVFYCAYGERSAMAVQAVRDSGLAHARHIEGGIDAWRRAGGPLVAPGQETTA